MSVISGPNASYGMLVNVLNKKKRIYITPNHTATPLVDNDGNGVSSKNSVKQIGGQLPTCRRKVERIAVSKRPVQFRSQWVQYHVNFIDHGHSTTPQGQQLSCMLSLSKEGFLVGCILLGREIHR